jgi:hypothetical protein
MKEVITVLYRKHNYLNKDIPYLISNEIVEYDMQSAGFNILKKYKLISDIKLKYLETLGKKHRQIQIGLYIKEDKELGKALNEKFIEVRQWFFENNYITDEDVLSIKKDAIVTLKRCHVTEFDNIIFVEKNIYTSYYYMNKYEFYYNKDIVHVKGISDDLVKLHTEYMLDFLYNFFKMNEISARKRVIDLLKSFSEAYKTRDLDIGYYRELNSDSLFRLNESLFGNTMGLKIMGDIDKVDIGYNFNRYLVPLISILV